MTAKFGNRLLDIAPGLLAAVVLALAAHALRFIPGVAKLSPLILAIVLGMAIGSTLRLPDRLAPGLAWTMRPLLRLGIVLLGLQITPAKLMTLGLGGFAVIAATLVATFLVTVRLGAWMGLRRELSELIAAGTSVCGASAVIAVNSVSNGSREDIAHAVAAVTLFGTASMLLMPALGPLFHLPAQAYGLWSGAAIHEIAQVVAAGFQRGQEAGEFATVAKLARVALLGPLVIALGFWRNRTAGKGADDASRGPVPFPWFVLGFLALVGFGGLVDLGPAVLGPIASLTTFLLAVALGAMGMMVDLRRLLREGWRPMALAAAAWLFVSGFSLLSVELVANGGLDRLP